MCRSLATGGDRGVGKLGRGARDGRCGETASAVRSPSYLLVAAGNLTGTCGEALTTRGAPSGEAWLFSVSISRMNFSASMGVASLVSSGAEQLRPPVGRFPGAAMLACRKWGVSADKLLLPGASNPGL